MAFKWKQDRSFKWRHDQKEQCSKDLEFEDDYMTIKKATGTSNIAHCPFGKEVNDTQCDIFTLDFKITNNDKTYLFIGYAIRPLKESLLNYHDYPGHGENTKKSNCFEICPDGILLCADDKCTNIYRYKFKSNELFRMQFDFVKGKLILYHGYKKIYQGKLLLNTKKIVIVGTLTKSGHQIEIVDYSFD